MTISEELKIEMCRKMTGERETEKKIELINWDRFFFL